MANKKHTPRRRLPHPMDAALGARIRQVRNAKVPKLPQQWLARELNIATQQMQKYEKGENRVAFSRLCEIAKALDMPVLELIAPLF